MYYSIKLGINALIIAEDYCRELSKKSKIFISACPPDISDFCPAPSAG